MIIDVWSRIYQGITVQSIPNSTGLYLPGSGTPASREENGCLDNGSGGERHRTASGSGGVHQQLPVREVNR